MADKIKGITVQIGGDTAPLSKALKGIDQEIRGTQSNLKEVNKLLKLDPSSTNLLKEKQKLLANQISDTTKKLDALKQAQEQAKKMLANGEIGEDQYKELGNQIAKCEKNLENLEKEAKDTSSKLKPSADKIAKGFQNAGSKIEAAGKKLAPLSALAAGGLTAGIKAAKDWESAFTGVKKTVEATEEQYEDLADAIQEMATRTSSSSEEIAAVAEVAGQLGVSADDLMDFVEVMVELGDTTNVNATDAAKALAQFTNITGSSKKDVKKLGSALVALGNNFATDEASILEMSQRLAAAGTQAGLSETDILALATAMSSVGINAEAGGTAMTQTMTQIEKIVSGTTKNSGEKLDKLAKVAGVDAKAFAKTWKENPIKALELFMTGLGQLDPEVESSTKVLDDLGMSGVRQSGMLKSLSLASDTLTGAIEMSSTAYEDNNALTTEANKKYGTLESKINQAKESAKQIGIEIGQELVPIIIDLLNGVKDVTKWFKSLDDKTKKTIVTIAGIVAAASPVLTIVGKLTKSIGGVVKAFSKFGKLLGGMGGPIAVTVAGIAAVVAAIKSHEKKLKDIRDAHAKLSDAEQKLRDKINAEANAWKDLKKQQSDAYPKIKDTADAEKKLWEQLKKVVDSNGKAKKGHEDEAKLLTGELAKALDIEINLVGDQIENYKELKGSIEQVISKKKAQAVLASGEAAYTEALSKHKEAAMDVAQAESDLYNQEKLVAEQEKKVKKTTEELEKAREDANDETGTGAARVQDLTNRLQEEQAALAGSKDKLTDIKGTYAQAKSQLAKYDVEISNYDELLAAVESGSMADMEDAMENLVNGFRTAKNSTKEDLIGQTKNFMTEFAKQASIVRDTGSKEVKSLGANTKAMVKKSIYELQKLDPAMAAEMEKLLEELEKETDWEDAGEDDADAFKRGVKNNIGLSVEDRIKAALDLKKKAEQWGGDMMKAYAKGIKDNNWRPYEKAKESADKVHKVLGFSEPEEGPLSDFHTYGPDMMKLLAEGIRSSEWQVLQAAQGVASDLRSMLQGTTVTAKLDQTSIPIGGGVTLNIANFNNYSDSDIRELTNEIMETAASFAARKGAVYA